MKAQELESDQIFEETGEVAGLDFTSKKQEQVKDEPR